MAGRRLLAALFWCICLCANAEVIDPSDGTEPKSDNPSADVAKSRQTRSFAALDNTPRGPLASPAFFTSSLVNPATEDELDLRQKIEATFEKVRRENRFVKFLDQEALIDLPVGIETDLGALKYVILIDSVVMTPKESFLYASMQFELPQNGKKIHFVGREIRFSKTGGLSGDGKLMLVGDYDQPLDGNQTMLVIKGSRNQTFVEFDCNGYKQLSLDASLMFSRELLVPVNEEGDAPNQNVSVDFTTIVSDWNDILVNVNVPSFRVASLEKVHFRVSDAVLDFSDTRNPAAVSFPEGYAARSPLMVGGIMELWRGVYIRELTVTLNQFETRAPDDSSTEGIRKPVSFVGSHLVLDNLGFSGKLAGRNLIPIEDGRIGSWNFSLESIGIEINANEISSAGFGGKINIPLARPVSEDKAPDETQLFAYDAIIKPGNEYVFNVRNSDALEFPLWKANVEIDPSSYVEVRVVNEQFLPKAHLNGRMTINIGLQDNGTPDANLNRNARIAGITFQQLEVSSLKPYVKVGKFSLGTEGVESKLGGFPIQVKGISGSSSGDDAIGLGLDLTLALVGENDGGFAADGHVRILSRRVAQSRILSYRFDKLEVDRFGIDIDKGPFKFAGTLNFYKEDIAYGNGISGTVSATFDPGFKLQASAIFGNKDGFRYWFADALAEFKNGITLFPSVAAYAFGGGAYHRMKMADKGVGSALGRTASGIVYVPDPSVGYGFKATMSLGIQPGKQAFNADVTYEMAFNSGGGVRYINFRGNGYFMSPLAGTDVSTLKQKATKLAGLVNQSGSSNLNEGNGDAAVKAVHGDPGSAGKKAQVWASAMMNYDFDNRTLHGNLKAFVNVAGGFIKGGGPGGQAGEAVLHFSPGEWYIYIGRPEYENRFAIEVLGIARLDAYFVIGSVVPDSPPPPSNVSEILGGIDLDYMKDLNQLADGAGVGFGASFRVDTGNLTFLIFYGRFTAGLGFDIMLKDYGDVYCKGGGQLGVNGWYANGQAYAYFEGKIGIRVRVWGKARKIDILDIGAAVVAQAKLPNPFWMRGIAGGRFKVLGGLVKGKCRFEITIGKECEIIRDEGDSVLETVEVLAQMTPADESNDVDVFVVPQAIFNFEMEREYQMVDPVDNSIVRFKISLDKFSLKHNGVALQAELKWNDDNTVAVLNPFEILPPKSELVLEAVVSFTEQQSGRWIVTTVDGAPLTKQYLVRFTTGDAPDHIPSHNIAYSYPTRGQFNYYLSEWTDNYITLKQGQNYLFADPEWEHRVRFTPRSGGVDLEAPLRYETAAKEVRFSVPENLEKDRAYMLNIVSLPRMALASVDVNVDTTRQALIAQEGIDISMTSRSAQGVLTEGQEKELCSFYFRTSQYTSFQAKMGAQALSGGWRVPVFAGVHKIGVNYAGTEPFSREEMMGGERDAPLIRVEADLNNVPWFDKEVHPLVYEDYPIEGEIMITLDNRNPSILGVVPIRAVYIVQYPYDIVLQPEAASQGPLLSTPIVGRIDYDLARVMYWDYQNLANQAAAYVVARGSTPRVTRLLTTPFPIIKGGDYWIDLAYVLPGRNKVTSRYRHKIFNPVD